MERGQRFALYFAVERIPGSDDASATESTWQHTPRGFTGTDLDDIRAFEKEESETCHKLAGAGGRPALPAAYIADAIKSPQNYADSLRPWQPWKGEDDLRLQGVYALQAHRWRSFVEWRACQKKTIETVSGGGEERYFDYVRAILLSYDISIDMELWTDKAGEGHALATWCEYLAWGCSQVNMQAKKWSRAAEEHEKAKSGHGNKGVQVTWRKLTGLAREAAIHSMRLEWEVAQLPHVQAEQQL